MMYTMGRETATSGCAHCFAKAGRLAAYGASSDCDPATDMADAERMLLPSFRFGTLVGTEPDGRKIYRNDAGTLMCEHGELASTIANWLLLEKKANEAGIPLPPRNSSCTCQSTEGLHKFKLTHCKTTTCTPINTPSMFEHLQSLDTDCKTFKGREARHIPFTQDEFTAYVTIDGRILCRHGRSRLTLQWDGKRARATGIAPRSACGCKPFHLPKRTGHHAMKLGACGDRHLSKFQAPLGSERRAPWTCERDASDALEYRLGVVNGAGPAAVRV